MSCGVLIQSVLMQHEQASCYSMFFPSQLVLSMIRSFGVSILGLRGMLSFRIRVQISPAIFVGACLLVWETYVSIGIRVEDLVKIRVSWSEYFN